MRKLKIALVVLLALTVSLGLVACGKKKKSEVSEVTIGNQLLLTENDDAKSLEGKRETLKVTVTYVDGTTAELKAKEWEFTEESLKSVTFGTIGNYTAEVQPIKNNERHNIGVATIVIDHDWGEPDANGVQVCKGADKATKTTNTTDVTVAYKGYHDTAFADLVKYGENAGDAGQRIKVFGKTGAGDEPHTATVGRLEKGMTISVRGEMQATAEGNTYYFPIIGLANRQTDAGFVVRNDGWGIYGGIGGGGVLAKSGLSDHTIESGMPDASTTDWEAKFEGTGSATKDYLQPQDVELTWRFVEKTDGSTTYSIVELGFYNYTINRSYTVRVKVPNRQFYDTVLHGEEIKMQFKSISVIQMLNLEDITTASIKTGAKKTYLENEMFDFSSLDVKAKFQQSETPQDFEVFEVFASTDTTVTADTKWQFNLENDKISKDMKSFKVVVTVGETVKEHVFTATEFPIDIKANAVDHANSNDVTKGDDTYIEPQLEAIPFTQNVTVNADGAVTAWNGKPQLTLTGAASVRRDSAFVNAAEAGDPTTLEKPYYVAFSVYANYKTDDEDLAPHYATRFTGTPTVEGTEGFAQIRGEGNALDVVLFLDKDTTTATIKGVNGDQDIIVDLTGITCREVLAYEVDSNIVYVNDDNNEVSIAYVIDVDPAADKTTPATESTAAKYAPKDVRLQVGSQRFVLTNALNADKTGWKEEFVAVGSAKSGIQVQISSDVSAEIKHPAIQATFKIDPDISNITSYDFQLYLDGTLAATNRVYPAFSFETGSKGVSLNDNNFAYADGTTLYIVTVKPSKDMTTKAPGIRASLHVAINAGSSTPAGFTDYDYIQAHDLSYVVDAAGNVTLTNSDLLTGFATAKFVTFGTIDNDEDTDRGAFLVVALDLTKLGYTKDSVYSFEVNPNWDGATIGGTYYTVAADRAITAKTYADLGTAAQLGDKGNCTTPTLTVVPVKDTAAGTKEDATFFAKATVAWEAHVWGTIAEGKTFAVCEKCGALRNYTDAATATTSVDGTNKTTDPLGTIEGLTVAFKVSEVNSDWGSAAITTAVGNMIITLPNLDPWNNSVNADIMNADNEDTPDVDESKTVAFAKVEDATDREKELADKVAAGNAFPAAENLFNGAAYNVFYGAASYVTISLSKTEGVKYYKNGVLVVAYPADKVVNAGTVADFVELFLSLAGRKGITIGRAGAKTENVLILKAYAKSVQVQDLYRAYSAQFGSLDATTGGSTSGGADIDYSETPTAAAPIELGKNDNTTGYTGDNPLFIQKLEWGKKIVLKGEMTRYTEKGKIVENVWTKDESGTLLGPNWHGPVLYVWEGDEEKPTWNMRADVFCNGAPADWNVVPSVGVCTGLGADFWNDLTTGVCYTMSNSTIEVTFDATDNTKIVVTFKATNKVNTGLVYEEVYTITRKPTNNWWIDESMAVPVEWPEFLNIGLGVDLAYIKLNDMTVS